MDTLKGAEKGASASSRPLRTEYTSVRRKKKHWKEAWPADAFLPGYSDLTSELESSSHPELEDQPLLEWGIKHGEAEEGPAAVDVMYAHGTDIGKRIFDWSCG
jgi:hypothetical protein